MSVIDKLTNLDRRIIYLIMGLAVVVPFLIPMRLPIYVSPPVQNVYDYIDDLPEGSVVLMGFNFSPSTMPELLPMGRAILRHCYSRKLKVMGMTFNSRIASKADEAMRQVAEEYGYRESEDYTYLGYKRDVVPVMLGLGEDISIAFPTDYMKTPISQIPMMKDIKNYSDIALVIDFGSANTPEAWVAYAGARYHQTIAVGCTGVMVSVLYPYLETGQLTGLIGGLKGAAEYERLVEKPGKGILGMKAQSIAHIAIILLVLIGNAGYLISRRRIEGK